MEQPNSSPAAAPVLYRASPQYLLREVAGSGVLVPIGEAAQLTNCLITLNETGSFLWKLFQTPHTAQQAAEAARAAYDAPEGQVEQHVRAYIREFVQQGLLQEV